MWSYCTVLKLGSIKINFAFQIIEKETFSVLWWMQPVVTVRVFLQTQLCYCNNILHWHTDNFVTEVYVVMLLTINCKLSRCLSSNTKYITIELYMFPWLDVMWVWRNRPKHVVALTLYIVSAVWNLRTALFWFNAQRIVVIFLSTLRDSLSVPSSVVKNPKVDPKSWVLKSRQ